MMIRELIFILFAGLTLGFAILAVTLKNLFHAALCLAAALFGVAGIFIFLGSEFLAAVQVLVYIGAITVLIIFALMLSPPQFLETGKKSVSKFFFCLAVSASLFMVLAALYLKFPVPAVEGARDFSLKHLGEVLLTKFVLPFEVIALVLLVAIIGAVIHAWEGAKK